MDACDILRPAYERINGTDGFASLEEVSPGLACGTLATVEEAVRLSGYSRGSSGR
jgi:transaldolase